MLLHLQTQLGIQTKLWVGHSWLGKDGAEKLVNHNIKKGKSQEEVDSGKANVAEEMEETEAQGAAV